MASKGTIQKRGKNSWRLSVNCGMDGNKKQIRKTKSITVKHACQETSCKNCEKLNNCKARKEAEHQLALFVAEVDKGTYAEPTKLTFKDFAERWLRDHGEQNLAPKTLYRYRQILESRIYPAMGHLKIEKIRPTHLIEFYANLQEDGIREDGKSGGLSEKTILQHHRIISSIMNTAVQWQVIPSNPASRVKPPKVKKKQAAYYNEEQTAALLTALDQEPLKYKVIVTLAIATGARRGELMALEWRDVDFNNSTIKIRHASQYLPGKGVFTKEPKNETSHREISVSSSIMAMLKWYKARQKKEQEKVDDLWCGSALLNHFNELFDAVTPKDITGAQTIKKLGNQKESFDNWEQNIKSISSHTNNEDFINELSKYGEKASLEIAALKTLSDKQLKDFISQWKEKSKGGRLFTTWNGKPMHPDTISSWFTEFISRHGLPKLTFHGLRHTAATLWMGSGAPIKNISTRLGHSNISTTGNIYSHALESVDRQIADNMDAIFTQKKAQK